MKRDITLSKQIRVVDTVLLNLTELPPQINKFSYYVRFASGYSLQNPIKYIEEISKLPETINSFHIQISKNLESIVHFTLKDHLLDLRFEFEETTQSNKVLAESLKEISQSIQRLNYHQDGALNNFMCSLQNFPSAKVVVQQRQNNEEEEADYVFQILENDFNLKMIGSNFDQFEIDSVIHQLKDVFQKKQIKNLNLKLQSLLSLRFTSWQSLLQQFQDLSPRIKSLNFSFKGVANNNEQHVNDFSQTLFARIADFPKKLEILKLKLQCVNFTDQSFQLFSNNISQLPKNLTYLKLNFGFPINNNVNYDLLFENIQQLPNSLTELYLLTSDMPNLVVYLENFKKCIGLFTKERRLKDFVIQTKVNEIKKIKESQTFDVVLNRVEHLNNIFNQLADETFYLEGVNKLYLTISSVSRSPTPQEIVQIGNELINISQQLQEVVINFNQYYPFGLTQESLVMYFKLANQKNERKLFQITSYSQPIFQYGEEIYYYQLKNLSNFQIINVNIFEELDKFLRSPSYQYKRIFLDFKTLNDLYLVKKLQSVHKFIHPQLKELKLNYNGCRLNDSDLPFQPQFLTESLQSCSVEKLNLDFGFNSGIHNKFLHNIFKRIYNWESLTHLVLNLDHTNVKSKGLNQFSKIIKGNLPNLKQFELQLTNTCSIYKLLSQSIVQLILALNESFCPQLEILILNFSEMKNRLNKQDLQEIGQSIAKLSQSIKVIDLGLENMIDAKGEGLKDFIRSIASLPNIEHLELNIMSNVVAYQHSVFFFVAEIPKYFVNSNKLELLKISCENNNELGIDQDKLLLTLIKYINQIDLTRSCCNFYIYKMLVVVGGYEEEAVIDIKKCTINKLTYDILFNFIFNLPPNVILSQDLELHPLYDNHQTQRVERMLYNNQDQSYLSFSNSQTSSNDDSEEDSDDNEEDSYDSVISF